MIVLEARVSSSPWEFKSDHLSGREVMPAPREVGRGAWGDMPNGVTSVRACAWSHRPGGGTKVPLSGIGKSWERVYKLSLRWLWACDVCNIHCMRATLIMMRVKMKSEWYKSTYSNQLKHGEYIPLDVAIRIKTHTEYIAYQMSVLTGFRARRALEERRHLRFLQDELHQRMLLAIRDDNAIAFKSW